MAGRGRGLRRGKIEAPKPRKSSSGNTPGSTRAVSGLAECLAEVQSLEQAIECGNILPHTIAMHTQSLRNCGPALDESFSPTMDKCFAAARRAVKNRTVGSLSCLHLLMLIELRESGWMLSPEAESYYNDKINSFSASKENQPPVNQTPFPLTPYPTKITRKALFGKENLVADKAVIMKDCFNTLMQMADEVDVKCAKGQSEMDRLTDSPRKKTGCIVIDSNSLIEYEDRDDIKSKALCRRAFTVVAVDGEMRLDYDDVEHVEITHNITVKAFDPQFLDEVPGGRCMQHYIISGLASDRSSAVVLMDRYVQGRLKKNPPWVDYHALTPQVGDQSNVKRSYSCKEDLLINNNSALTPDRSLQRQRSSPETRTPSSPCTTACIGPLVKKLIDKPVQLSKDLDLSDILPGKAAMWHQNHSTGIFEFYVSIPVELAGKVMGKGGTHIKRLQQLSNTVISMNKADSDDEKELILRGRTEESVLEGVEILEHFLRTGQFLGEDQEEDAASSISRTSSVDSRPAPSPRRQSSPPSLTTSPPSLSVKSPPSSAQSPTPQPTQPTSPLPTPTKSLDLDDVFSEIKIEQLHIAGHLMSLHCENKALLREASAVLKAHFNQPKVATPKSPPLPSSCDRGVVVYNDLDFSEDLACETSGLQSSKQKGNISATDCPLPDDSWQQDDRLTSTPARSLSMPTASAGLEISSIPAARNNETTEAATLDRAHLSRSLMADSSSVEKLRSCRSRGFGAGGRLGLFGYIQPTNITRDPLCPLSSRSEICQAESEDCSQGSLSVSERRKQFAVCTNKKNSREGSETKDDRLVYAPSFLLACSRSPFARSPPKNWAEFSGSVPEICLDKMSDDFKLPRLRSVSMSANVTSDIFLSEPGNKGSRPNSISLEWDGNPTAL